MVELDNRNCALLAGVYLDLLVFDAAQAIKLGLEARKEHATAFNTLWEGAKGNVADKLILATAAQVGRSPAFVCSKLLERATDHASSQKSHRPELAPMGVRMSVGAMKKA